MTRILFGLIQWGRVEPTDPYNRYEDGPIYRLLDSIDFSDHRLGNAADHIHHQHTPAKPTSVA